MPNHGSLSLSPTLILTPPQKVAVRTNQRPPRETERAANKETSRRRGNVCESSTSTTDGAVTATIYFLATAANVAAPYASGISTGCLPYKKRGLRRVDQPAKSCAIGGGEFFSDAGFEKEGNKRFLRVGIGGLGPGSVDKAVLTEGLRGSQVKIGYTKFQDQER
ncbi:hypothetical protein MUK42_06493 [Musa troglodytarum]|uniref:Uncharacterized protein n=1 Tax=Musa troglodytarum TaxID=320322 RepID=A0A9E7FJB9_9LILI|nr:hypothetical protein MUK42_06493 [Musa troglodytarum]